MNDIYSSRSERGSAIIARQDPVVYDEGQYADALEHEQLSSYEKNGFLVLENVFSEEETAALMDEVLRLSTDRDIARLKEAITEPSSDAVRSVFRVHELSERIDVLARDPRLLDVRSEERRVGKECRS